jgi:hypothetical protein
VRGLTLRLRVEIGGAPADVGRLSTRMITTAEDGRAEATFRAPPPTFATDTLVSVVVTPVGSDAASAVPRVVAILLLAKGRARASTGLAGEPVGTISGLHCAA